MSTPAHSWFVLDVPEVLASETASLVAELWLEELHQPLLVPRDRRPLWQQPAFAAAACLALGLVGWYAVSGGSTTPGEWFRSGALTSQRWLAGQYWLAITAATLHADVGHLFGNVALGWLLAWGVAERTGPGTALLGFLLAAVCGFVVSMEFPDPPAVTVGASGGVFGLLGIAGGHALRRAAVEGLPRREALRGLGAALMLLAFMAFSPSSNITAHVAGFAAGVGLGGCRWATAPGGRQTLMGAIAVLAVVGAWVWVALSGATAWR